MSIIIARDFARYAPQIKNIRDIWDGAARSIAAPHNRHQGSVAEICYAVGELHHQTERRRISKGSAPFTVHGRGNEDIGNGNGERDASSKVR
jgi:hypothetical protein